MISYFSLFPEKCSTEMRTVSFPGHKDMPKGTIVFNEFFCPDQNCNCERVLIGCEQVRDESSVPTPYAMISYSWNSSHNAPWRNYLGNENPFLDPLHPNGKFANNLKLFWCHMHETDTVYRQRIIRHYQELRDAVGKKYTTDDDSATAVGLKRKLTSMLESSLSENPILTVDHSKIKKKDRTRHEALQKKIATRRKPK